MKRSKENTARAYKTEVDCLELLRHLRHECIVELLASYEHRNEHYLIFPILSMDLSEFLTREERFGDFVNNSTFYNALSGLTSAVQSIHEISIVSEDLLISKIGYHHDIRPKNILVKPNMLVLTDFGLARFKMPDEGSQTRWKNTIGDYIAPECMSEDYTHLEVGRSIDIWSLGCLLTEVAAYMERGPSGVMDFRQKRRRTEFKQPLENSYFFEGKKLRISTDDWISDLTRRPKDRGVRALIHCARNQLQVEVEKRPKAAQVASRLQYVRMKMMYREIKTWLDSFMQEPVPGRHGPSPHDRLSALFQCEMLGAWGKVLGMENDYCRHEYFEGCKDQVVIDGALQKLLVLLRNTPRYQLGNDEITITNRPQFTRSSVEEKVQGAVQELWSSVPVHYQHRMEQVWRQTTLDTDDITFLSEVEDGMRVQSPQTEIGIHAALRRLAIEFENQGNKSSLDQRKLLLNPMQVERVKPLSSNHEIGKIEQFSATSAKGLGDMPIVIEWMLYSPVWAGQSDEEKIVKTLGLAEILSQRIPESFHTLNCLGVLPPSSELHHGGFAFVYAFPPSYRADPVSLSTFLREKGFVVLLEDKFRIAQCLATSLAEFHSVQWLHKNIQSVNILFFTQAESFSSSASMSQPHLVGFQHSRPNGEIWCSDMDETETNSVAYRDPRYTPGGKVRFRKEFDYYSLGIVLLEIGFWEPIASFKRQHQQLSREAFRDILVQKYAPKLGPKMGSRYKDIVIACLDGFRDEEVKCDKKDAEDSFFWKVVNPLCNLKLV